MQLLISNMETIKKTTFDRVYALQVANIVANTGSFAAAARKVNTSPSNITKEIQKLEEYLGIKLFNRTTRSISVTEQGKFALEKSKNILNMLSDMEDELKGNADITRGLLRISAPTSLGENIITDLIVEFQILHPYIEIELDFTDRVLDPIEHGIDLSIRSSNTLPDSSLFSKKVGELHRTICVGPKYLEHFKLPKNPQKLKDHNCLLYNRAATPFHWTLEKSKKQESINVQGNFSSNNLKTVLRACKQGLGISNMPKYLIQNELKEGTLIELFKSWNLPRQNIYLLTTTRPSKLRKLQTLVSFLEERFKANKTLRPKSS